MTPLATPAPDAAAPQDGERLASCRCPAGRGEACPLTNDECLARALSNTPDDDLTDIRLADLERRMDAQARVNDSTERLRRTQWMVICLLAIPGLLMCALVGAVAVRELLR